MAQALAGKPDGGFFRVEFEDFPRSIFLDSAHLSEEDAKIQRTYGLPSLRRLE